MEQSQTEDGCLFAHEDQSKVFLEERKNRNEKETEKERRRGEEAELHPKKHR